MHPYKEVAVLSVKINLIIDRITKKGEEFSRLKGVIAVNVVTGRFDLILVVLLKSGFGPLEFYTEEAS